MEGLIKHNYESVTHCKCANKFVMAALGLYGFCEIRLDSLGRSFMIFQVFFFWRKSLGSGP